MMAPNEVKFKVRHCALLLEEFTVSQIVELTGLKSSSVRTEVQRMRRDGLVTASRQKAQGRGGPPCVYKLTDDPEARLAFSKSVEGFYIETIPRSIEARRPASRHFFQAAQLIQDLLTRKVEDSELDAVTEEAAYHLEFARREEGVGREGTEIIGAFLNREMAKLEAVRGNFAEAEGLFRQSITAFEDAALQDEVERIHRDWLCVLMRQQIEIVSTDRTLDWLHTVELLQDSLSKASAGDLEKCSLAILLKGVLDLVVEKGQAQQLRQRILNDASTMKKEIAQEVAQETVQKVREMLQSERLKSGDVDIPLDKMMVLTDEGGWGKSSMALHTIYAEGMGRYMESQPGLVPKWTKTRGRTFGHG